MGRAGTSNRWWDSRCGCGHSARRCGCAPPDFAELLARVGVPLVPVGQPERPLVTGATPPSAADLPRRAAELVAAQFDTVAAVAEGCDALVATGVMPAGVWR
jgi:vancomycin aglycone glucosyltransferase